MMEEELEPQQSNVMRQRLVYFLVPSVINLLVFLLAWLRKGSFNSDLLAIVAWLVVPPLALLRGFCKCCFGESRFAKINGLLLIVGAFVAFALAVFITIRLYEPLSDNA